MLLKTLIYQLLKKRAKVNRTISVKTNAFLDPGSDSTLIQRDLAASLMVRNDHWECQTHYRKLSNSNRNSLTSSYHLRAIRRNRCQPSMGYWEPKLTNQQHNCQVSLKFVPTSKGQSVTRASRYERWDPDRSWYVTSVYPKRSSYWNQQPANCSENVIRMGRHGR